MSEIFKLTDLSDKTFVNLSPLSKIEGQIEGETVGSVISYAYAGILPKKDRVNMLREDPRYSREYALRIFDQQQKDILKNALYKGYEILLNKKGEYGYENRKVEALLNTGSRLIVFRNSVIRDKSNNVKNKSDTLLGVDNEGKGENIIGEVLMKLRSIYRSKMKEKVEMSLNPYRRLDHIYHVYHTLYDRIVKGEDNLSSFINKTPEEIMEMLSITSTSETMAEKRKSQIIDALISSLKPFIQILPQNEQKTMSPYDLVIKHSRNIAYFLRRAHNVEYSAEYISKYRMNLLENYMKTVTGDSPYYSLIRKEFLERLGVDGMEEMKQRLDALSTRMGKDRDIVRDKYFINIEDDILSTKSLQEIDDKRIILRAINNLSGKGEIQEIIDYGDSMVDMLSPYYGEMTDIENYTFPSIIHYVYTKMLESVHIKETKGEFLASYLLIKNTQKGKTFKNFKKISEIKKLYYNKKDEYIRFIVVKRAIKALKFKFQEDEMRKILTYTKPYRLLYDSNDTILGTGKIDSDGKYEGSNEIGNAMEEIRVNILSLTGGKYPDYIPKSKLGSTLDELLNMVFSKQSKDTKSVHSWIMGQLQEMINLLVNVKNYLKEKLKIEEKYISGEDIFFVINQIYSVCHIVEKIVDQKKYQELKLSGIPSDIEIFSKDFFKKNNYEISYHSLEKIWSYLLVLILSIEMAGDFKIDKFEKEINNMAKKQFEKTKCTKNILYNIEDLKESQKITGMINQDEIEEKEYINCISQAILNLLDKVKEFHSKKTKNTKFVVEIVDLHFIYNIMSYYTNEPIPDVRSFALDPEPLRRPRKIFASKRFVNENLGKVESEKEGIIRRLLSSKHEVGSSDIISYFGNIVETLLSQSEQTKYRILYFAEQSSSSEKKIKHTKRDTKKQEKEQKEDEDRLEYFREKERQENIREHENKIKVAIMKNNHFKTQISDAINKAKTADAKNKIRTSLTTELLNMEFTENYEDYGNKEEWDLMKTFIEDKFKEL